MASLNQFVLVQTLSCGVNSPPNQALTSFTKSQLRTFIRIENPRFTRPGFFLSSLKKEEKKMRQFPGTYQHTSIFCSSCSFSSSSRNMNLTPPFRWGLLFCLKQLCLYFCIFSSTRVKDCLVSGKAISKCNWKLGLTEICAQISQCTGPWNISIQIPQDIFL